MVQRNKNIAKLPAGYLFPVIAKKRREYQEKNPTAKIISLGIGDTPGPLPKNITDGLVKAAEGMGTAEGYSGYPDLGLLKLRQLINQRFYNNQLDPDEILISDGAKCDVGRLQVLFGADVKIAVQDPVYPAYVDSSVALGQTGEFNPETKQFGGITYLPCNPANNFFPDLTPAKNSDLIFICSPNNPTGACANRQQLTELVAFAKANKAIIMYDAAYSVFIQDPELPKSIFEIPGAKDVAIEMHSFSKSASFTGVRLGWTVVPKDLKFDDGSSVLNDWIRLTNTIYNGTSHITQLGGIGALEDSGWEEIKQMTAEFLENARLIKDALVKKDVEVYAGENAPYLWAKIPGRTSWETFDYLLEQAQIVCTPGSGFGIAGEGFVRFSAFGKRADILEAIKRLEKFL